MKVFEKKSNTSYYTPSHSLVPFKIMDFLAARAWSIIRRRAKTSRNPEHFQNKQSFASFIRRYYGRGYTAALISLFRRIKSTDKPADDTMTVALSNCLKPHTYGSRWYCLINGFFPAQDERERERKKKNLKENGNERSFRHA